MGIIKITAKNIHKVITEDYTSIAKSLLEQAESISKEATVENLEWHSQTSIDLKSSDGIIHKSYSPEEPSIEFEPYKDETIHREVIQNIVYEKKTTLTLESDYAVTQLQKVARKDSMILFTYVFKRIYGEYFSIETLSKLYEDAKNKASILQPKIIISKDKILGNYAAYDNKTQQILISSAFILKALDDNDTMGELLVALVEEHGHHINWLLRNHYGTNDKTKPRKRLHGDIGAKYSYQIIDINAIETQEQAFGSVSIKIDEYENEKLTNSTTKDEKLIWKYRNFHTNLKQHVNSVRQNTSDSDYSKRYNFYKAGTIDVGHGHYGHQDIENEALKKTLIKDFNIRNEDEIKKILHKIYLGNWLRDYSQMIDPGIIRPLSNAAIAYSKGQPLNSLGALGKLNTGNPSNAPVKVDIPKDVNLKYKGELLSPSTWLDFSTNVVYEKVEIRPITWSRGLMTQIVKNLAMREFMEIKDHSLTKDNFEDRVKAFEKEYFDIDEKKLGVYRPDEHIDNPKTDPIDKNAHNPKLNTGDAYGFVGQPSKEEMRIGMAYGMKNYIRADKSSSGFSTKRTAYEYVEQKIKAAAKSNPNFKDAHLMADFGAALHVIEDYFAHSNYVEIAASKVSKNDRVFPWIDKIENPKPYVGSIDFNYDKFAKMEPSKAVQFLAKKSTPSIVDKSHTKIDTAIGTYNQIARFIPVVTGTFAELDMLASLMPILKDKVFSIEISPYYNLKPGDRTDNDALLLEILKDLDESQSIDKGQKSTDYVDGFKRFLEYRDLMEEGKEHVPKIIREKFHYFMERISAMLNFMFFHLIKIIAGKLGDAQLLLQQQVEQAELGTISIGTDPSHTQIAKDDPGKPMHELSALLAVEAVRSVGEKMFACWKGKITVQEVLDEVDRIMQHPAKSTWQDNMVAEWCKKNPKKLCKATSPSVIIDAIIDSITELDEFNNKLIGMLETAPNKAMESILEEIDPDGKLITSLKKLSNKNAILLKRAKLASKNYNKKYYKPQYCRK